MLDLYKRVGSGRDTRRPTTRDSRLIAEIELGELSDDRARLALHLMKLCLNRALDQVAELTGGYPGGKLSLEQGRTREAEQIHASESYAIWGRAPIRNIQINYTTP
jgi:hypothetical protein